MFISIFIKPSMLKNRTSFVYHRCSSLVPASFRKKMASSKRLRISNLSDKENVISAIEHKFAKLKMEEKKLAKEIDAYEAPDVDNERLKLLQILTAYRLYGVTILEKSDNHLRIRLDPNYNGVYIDKCEFVLKKREKKWTVEQHNLPYFMTLSSILKETFEDDPKAIVDLCTDYLNSYTCRRVQVMETLEKYPEIKIEWTALYQLVALHFGTNPKMYGVKLYLMYGVYDELPGEKSLYIKDPQPSKRQLDLINEYANKFDKLPIVKAIQSIMKD